MNPTTVFLRAAVSLAALPSFSACVDRGNEQTQSTPQVHADHGTAGEKLTYFTQRTELFVEFPRLVAGETSAFAAHVTRLVDFKAVTAAKVTVILSGGGQPDEIFATQTPTQLGIRRPEAMPKHAGGRELAIEIATSNFTVRHLLGPITVYADRMAAEGAPRVPEDDSA